MKQGTVCAFTFASIFLLTACGVVTPGTVGGDPCGDGGSGGASSSAGGGGETASGTGAGGYCVCDCPAGPPTPMTVSEFCDSAPIGAPCCLWHNTTTLLIGQCSADHVCYYTDF